jgi:hypothetical protein
MLSQPSPGPSFEDRTRPPFGPTTLCTSGFCLPQKPQLPIALSSFLSGHGANRNFFRFNGTDPLSEMGHLSFATTGTFDILSSFVDSKNNACPCATGDTSSPTPLQLRVREVLWPRIAKPTLPKMTVYGNTPIFDPGGS